MGFGYFFAIALNMPPLDDRAIDVGQGRAIFRRCLHGPISPQWPNYSDEERFSMMPVKATMLFER
jgi:hypothetical protein